MKKKNGLYRANKKANAIKCPVCQVLFNIGNHRLRKSPNPDLCPDEDFTFMINSLDDVIKGLYGVRCKILKCRTTTQEDWNKAAIPLREAMESFMSYNLKSADPGLPVIYPSQTDQAYKKI